MLPQNIREDLIQIRELLDGACSIINDRDNIEEVALLYATDAEKRLTTVLDTIIDMEIAPRTKRLLEMALGHSEPLEKRPFHIARTSLDALVIFKNTETLPKWDIETYRAISQMAEWRQRASSHLAQLITLIDKAEKYLESGPNT